MSGRQHRAYWQWRVDAGGGYDEVFILSLYDDAVELVAHIDYHASRERRAWTLAEARTEERRAFEGIPDADWADFRARLG